MIFTEGRFFVFFLVAFAVHWALRSNVQRKVWLLVTSYAFYAAWDWRFLGLILFSTLVDYTVGVMLGRAAEPRARKAWLLVSLVANLGLLGFFKYFNFFIDSGARVLDWMGLGAHDWTLNILLPVGISFYTFQTLSYSIDVYRRRLEPVRSLLDLAVFVGFFPQLVAGPIVRAAHFLPLLTEKRRWADVAVRPALSLFLFGFIKKACLADNAAQIADQVFGDPGAYSNLGTWLGLFMYNIQLYCDFSGYSDMAIATAALLGYHLPDNFDFPWFSRNINDFWRRWHISLSSWAMDYIYIPLGGSRGSEARTIFNFYVTMGLIGLWHGAAWTFVLFGLLHATYVAIYRIYRRVVAEGSSPAAFFALVGCPLTVVAVQLSFLPFRSESVGEMWTLTKVVLFLERGGELSPDPLWFGVYVGAGLAHWVTYKRYLHGFFGGLPTWAWSLVYGGAWALTLPWVATGYTPFIYFRF
ncbi:MAG: MBOAT family O-acyltransferase [Planctomycetota bacterium]